MGTYFRSGAQITLSRRVITMLRCFALVEDIQASGIRQKGGLCSGIPVVECMVYKHRENKESGVGN